MKGTLARRVSRAAAMIMLALLAAACTTGRAEMKRTPEPSAAAMDDTAFFAAVVRQAISWPDPYSPFRIDPRPLRADPTITQPTVDALADVPQRVVALRTAVLRRMGMPPTDAVQDARCPGLDIPPPGMKPRHRPGCPESGNYTSKVFGLPRRGGPYWPNAAIASGTVKVPDVDQREPGLSLGYWSVRVISKDVRPTGGSHSVSDYVFKHDPASGAWLFIERKVFYIAD